MRTAALISTALLLAGTATPQEDPIALARARLARQHEDPGRRVLSFYYPWYGTVAFGGTERHWGAFDAARKDAPASLRWPAGGPYDSCDPALVARHMDDFAASGIDGPIVSWWGPGDHSDRALPLILAAAERRELEVTVYLEVVHGNPPGVAAAVRDLVYLARRYAAHPAWLRVGDRPVIFLYSRVHGQLDALAWVRALAQARAASGIDWFAIADGITPEFAALFDGIHTYNTMGRYLGRPEAEWPTIAAAHVRRVADLARPRAHLACATIVPGYDDTKIREPGAALDRAEGRLYDLQWRAAIADPPDWILITSYNEWHEGSEIEASAELGDRTMKATGRWTARWRAARPPTRAERAARPHAATLAKLVEQRIRGKIGLLGGLGSVGLALLGATDRLAPLTAAQLVAGEIRPSGYPLLIYVGGERYPAMVAQPGDVPAALETYLAAGGRLIVLGSEPLPFYYDGDGLAANAGRRFGLHLLISTRPGRADGPRGFERPPPDRELSFAISENLPALPRTLPFPTAGDLRWRPVLEPRTARHYHSLIRLVDDSGASWGNAAALIERTGGGKLLYAWFRLADAAPLEALLTDLIRVMFQV